MSDDRIDFLNAKITLLIVENQRMRDELATSIVSQAKCVKECKRLESVISGLDNSLTKHSHMAAEKDNAIESNENTIRQLSMKVAELESTIETQRLSIQQYEEAALNRGRRKGT